MSESEPGYAYLSALIIEGAEPRTREKWDNFQIEVYGGNVDNFKVTMGEPITEIRPHLLRRIESSVKLGRKAWRAAKATEEK